MHLNFFPRKDQNRYGSISLRLFTTNQSIILNVTFELEMVEKLSKRSYFTFCSQKCLRIGL